MRRRKVTPAGQAIRAKLSAKLASMGWEEVFDALQDLVPHSTALHVQPATPISVTGPTLVVAKKLGELLKFSTKEQLLSKDFGFLPGPARDEFLVWYVDRVLPVSRRGFFSCEMAKLQGLSQLRAIMEQAGLV